jgi:hypothetical protein
LALFSKQVKTIEKLKKLKKKKKKKYDTKMAVLFTVMFWHWLTDTTHTLSHFDLESVG